MKCLIIFKKYKWLLFIALACTIVVVFGFWRYQENTRLRLPGGYVWRLHNSNEMVIVNPRNKIIVGPGYLQIWGNYPYIYGIGGSYFILNTSDDKLELFDSWKDFVNKLDALELRRIGEDRYMANLYDFIVQEGNKTRAEEFLNTIRKK